MYFVKDKNFPDLEEMDEFLNDFSNLTHHQQIQDKALKFIKNIDGVEAIFLGGSLANETGDIFSDIDFYVVLKDNGDKEKVAAVILNNLDEFGHLIHVYPSAAKRQDVIVYFKPLVKFELAFKSLEQIRKSWKMGSAAMLLFDRNGLGQEALENAKKIEFDFRRYEDEVRRLAVSLPSFCFITAGYILRGEIITSKDFIAWMRRNLMRISGFLLGIWDEGTRRAEQRFPTEILNYYNLILLGTEEQMWDALDTLLDWYENFLCPEFDKKQLVHAKVEVDPMRNLLKTLRIKGPI